MQDKDFDNIFKNRLNDIPRPEAPPMGWKDVSNRLEKNELHIRRYHSIGLGTIAALLVVSNLFWWYRFEQISDNLPSPVNTAQTTTNIETVPDKHTSDQQNPLLTGNATGSNVSTNTPVIAPVIPQQTDAIDAQTRYISPQQPAYNYNNNNNWNNAGSFQQQHTAPKAIHPLSNKQNNNTLDNSITDKNQSSLQPQAPSLPNKTVTHEQSGVANTNVPIGATTSQQTHQKTSNTTANPLLPVIDHTENNHLNPQKTTTTEQKIIAPTKNTTEIPAAISQNNAPQPTLIEDTQITSPSTTAPQTDGTAVNNLTDNNMTNTNNNDIKPNNNNPINTNPTTNENNFTQNNQINTPKNPNAGLSPLTQQTAQLPKPKVERPRKPFAQEAYISLLGGIDKSANFFGQNNPRAALQAYVGFNRRWGIWLETGGSQANMADSLITHLSSINVPSPELNDDDNTVLQTWQLNKLNAIHYRIGTRYNLINIPNKTTLYVSAGVEANTFLANKIEFTYLTTHHMHDDDDGNGGGGGGNGGGGDGNGGGGGGNGGGGGGNGGGGDGNGGGGGGNGGGGGGNGGGGDGEPAEDYQTTDKVTYTLPQKNFQFQGAVCGIGVQQKIFKKIYFQAEASTTLSFGDKSPNFGGHTYGLKAGLAYRF